MPLVCHSHVMHTGCVSGWSINHNAVREQQQPTRQAHPSFGSRRFPDLRTATLDESLAHNSTCLPDNRPLLTPHSTKRVLTTMLWTAVRMTRGAPKMSFGPLVRLPPSARVFPLGTANVQDDKNALLRFPEQGLTIGDGGEEAWAVVGDAEGRRLITEVSGLGGTRSGALLDLASRRVLVPGSLVHG
jgi:hypothetical protein